MPTTVTMTRPAPAAAPAYAEPSADLGYLAVVSVAGGLRLPAAASGTTATALRRRTQTGTTCRVDLGEGITCWLDGDQQDGSGELNWIATAMCTALSTGTFAGPDDAPFVCGQALFTGTAGERPIGLSERQLRRVVDAHAEAGAASVIMSIAQLTGPCCLPPSAPARSGTTETVPPDLASADRPTTGAGDGDPV